MSVPSFPAVGFYYRALYTYMVQFWSTYIAYVGKGPFSTSKYTTKASENGSAMNECLTFRENNSTKPVCTVDCARVDKRDHAPFPRYNVFNATDRGAKGGNKEESSYCSWDSVGGRVGVLYKNGPRQRTSPHPKVLCRVINKWNVLVPRIHNVAA